MRTSPTDHRNKQMQIEYAVSNCPLGRLLVAGTARGISAIYLGKMDASLETALRREYPDARIRRNPARVAGWVRPLVRHLAGRQAQLRLPLDLRATAFQRQVWAQLQKIPYGSMRSYSEISRQIGKPKAARAVGRACASNPVSLLIPCHRVVREDGKLGGYRWGMARKRALLEKEKGRRRARQ